MKEGPVMGERIKKMELTDEQMAQVTGGTGEADDTYDGFRQHFIGFGEGGQNIEDTYNQLDADHIGNIPELSHAPQGPLEGLQALLGSGLAPGPTPESGYDSSGASSAGGLPFGAPPPEPTEP